ncbi:MAG TPA: hypothetical protein VEA69_16805 [Tepidisphaeraceae bacterium]|nr:hypothetical protein [Tepidisphaeraceae bacterium]
MHLLNLETPAPPPARYCLCGCGKRIHRDNRHGVCVDCRASGAAYHKSRSFRNAKIGANSAHYRRRKRALLDKQTARRTGIWIDALRASVPGITSGQLKGSLCSHTIQSPRDNVTGYVRRALAHANRLWCVYDFTPADAGRDDENDALGAVERFLLVELLEHRPGDGSETYEARRERLRRSRVPCHRLRVQVDGRPGIWVVNWRERLAVRAGIGK